MTNNESYFVCSIPYQLAIKERLLPAQQVREEMQELTFNEISWLIEMEAIFYGQSMKSIYKFEELQRSRKVAKTFYAPEVSSLINDKKFKVPEKIAGEIRALSVDISVIAGKNNDATAVTVARLIPKKNGYDREIVYLDTREGGHTGQQALMIKRLKEDFDCDYIVIDRAGAGIGVFDALLEKTIDSERGEDYPAWSCMNDEELAKRCNEPNAPKIIFAINATADFNSEIALKLKDSFNKNKLFLPIMENEGREYLLSNKKYADLPIELRERFMMPFVHSTLLVNEIINLEAEINELGRIKLKEARSARKDRFSSLAYLNYFATYLENKNKKQKNTIADPSRLFMARKAKSYKR